MSNPLSTTLRPGLLVGLSTAIKGNVKYNKTETVESMTDGGVLVAEWETERTTLDPKEHELAVKVRAKARSLVGSVCAATAFGFLCAEEDRADLDKAFAEAAKLCEEFNVSARVTRIKFYAVTGRIAPDDAGAVRAINSEIRGLIADMQDGIDKLDVEAVRNAAKRATQLGSMLNPDAQAKMQDAIKAARSIATQMVKAGEQVAIEIDAATINKLTSARTAFLDLDDATEVAAPEDTSGRALDLAPHEAVAEPAAPVTPDLDIEDLL